MTVWLLLAAAVVAGLGLWLWIRARRARRETGLPAGRIAYVDSGAWNRCERPLYSRRYRLTGRPDYIVRGPDGAIIPVEVKTGASPRQPYAAHVMQLAAYCLLVAEQEGRLPPYGIVKYPASTFEVPFTPALQAELLAMLKTMRCALAADDVEPNHDDPRRCRGCGYQGECERRLV
jgi:CRISPR-associated exonuclease Cas4